MSLTRTELKKVRSLLTGKGRRAEGLFVAEGVRLLEEALRFKRPPSFVCYAESLLSERAAALLGRFRSLGIELHALPAADLNRLAAVESSQGLVGVFPIPQHRLSQLYRPRMRNILLCENLADPGNVGTLWRSALAFGFDLFVLAGSTADPYAPKTVRASAGAVFGLPVAETGYAELKEVTGDKSSRTVASTPRAKRRLADILADVKGKRLILAVGSEADGLSNRLLTAAAHRVRIDHRPDVESLNSAVAGSILMKECYDLRVRRTR